MPREYKLISTDSHVNEPPDTFIDRVPVKFRDRAPRMEHLPQGSAWVMEGATEPINFGLNCNVGNPKDTRNLWVKWEDVRPGGWNPAERVKEQDKDGVDLELMYPTPRIANHVTWYNKDNEFHIACVRAYNDWLSEYCSYAPDRFWGAALMPSVGVDAAIEELHRIQKLPGLRTPLLARYPDGGEDLSPNDDRFFAAVAEAGMAISIHVEFALQAGGDHAHRAKRKGIFRFFDASLRIHQLIDGGVFDRFPSLNVVFAETDAGWLPYVAEQMDDRHGRHSAARRANIKLMPSEYFKRNIFATYVTDTYGIRNRHDVGLQNMMWSSDYPHSGSNWPNSWKVIREQFEGIPPAEQHALLAGNALAVYGPVNC